MTRGVAVVLAALAVVAAGCGGGEDSKSALAWQGRPRLLTPPTLPNDRVLTGRVRNDSGHVLALVARDTRVIDADGRRLTSTAIFVGSFIRRLQPFNRNDPVSTREQERVGYIARLKPGESIPLTVSWRQPQGRPAARVALGGASLDVPG